MMGEMLMDANVQPATREGSRDQTMDHCRAAGVRDGVRRYGEEIPLADASFEDLHVPETCLMRVRCKTINMREGLCDADQFEASVPLAAGILETGRYVRA